MIKCRSALCLFMLLLSAAVALSAPEGSKKAAVAAPHQAQKKLAPIVTGKNQPLQDQTEAFFEHCPQGEGWIKFRRACYKYIEKAEYWEPAERACQATPGGHLVSIEDKTENAFVGKLTYCESAWTGKFAVHVDKLRDPTNYRWSDNTTTGNQYHDAHDFTGLNSIHFPLIAAFNLTWRNKVYHDKQLYVCKVSVPQRNYTCDCPTGWKQLDNHCYLMPHFEATYIEGDYYCRGRDAYMVSLHNERELRAMSLLDLDSITCPQDTWIGLLKLNPCRIDFSTGAPICYRWSDRSGDYAAFPEWHAGSPNPDQVTNCVALKDRQIKTIPCHTRARFVCKKKVESIVHTRQCTA